MFLVCIQQLNSLGPSSGQLYLLGLAMGFHLPDVEWDIICWMWKMAAFALLGMVVCQLGWLVDKHFLGLADGCPLGDIVVFELDLTNGTAMIGLADGQGNLVLTGTGPCY